MARGAHNDRRGEALDWIRALATASSKPDAWQPLLTLAGDQQAVHRALAEGDSVLVIAAVSISSAPEHRLVWTELVLQWLREEQEADRVRRLLPFLDETLDLKEELAKLAPESLAPAVADELARLFPDLW